MKISKILNNNVVIAEDENDKELILMGLGLGFAKKVGNEIEEEKIEKIFSLQVEGNLQHLTDLLAEIPIEIIELSMEALSEAKKIRQEMLSDMVLITFADHLNTAIIRVREGIVVKNFLLWDIKRFFPAEFAICNKLLEKVKAKYGLDLAEDEIGFLAMHLVNSSLGEHQYAADLTQLMEEILTTIKYTLKINFDEENIYFQRFITHLKFFVERILSDSNFDEKVDEDLFNLVTHKYTQAYIATTKVSEFLMKTRAYAVSQSEQVYMTVHLARILEKN